jgi:fucose 4-O-acetylase-like acetyltransferase
MIKEYLSEKLRIISFSSMILIVFLHSYNLGDEIIKINTSIADRSFVFFLQYFISQGIARVAVPIFFAISGYLFFVNRKNTLGDYAVNLQKRFKSLVVPYLFWSISFFLFFLFLQLLPQTASLFKQKLIINY